MERHREKLPLGQRTLRYFCRLGIILLVLLHAIFTPGCSNLPRDTVEVEVPVPVACVARDDLPPDLQVSDEKELLKLDRRKRTLKVWDERLLLKDREARLRALLIACTGGE